jgi:cytoskeletal protein RodZ
MDELGNILREAREMKGLTLGDVQDEIRISSRYLQALEAGDYTMLPTAVHARGFLRNYARFLELDPRPLLERFEATVKQQLPAAPSNVSVTTRSDQTFFNPVNLDLEGNAVGGPERKMRLVIVLALLITIGLAASRFVPLLRGSADGRDNLPALIQSLLATNTPEPPAGDAQDGAVTPGEGNLPASTSQPILPTERNNPEAAGTAAAATPPISPALPATMESIRLRLDITERTWVRVTIDGEVVLEDQVTQDDSPFEWEASTEAQLLTGNAAGVFVTINDVEIGRLGGRGEVAEQHWATTEN